MLHYDIKITEQPYLRNGEKISDRSVIIAFLNENNQTVKTETYALITSQDVYARIKSGSDINLNNCYIKNFSLDEYRSAHNINPSTPVLINNLNAINSFFDSDKEVSFSFSIISGKEISFKSSYFSSSQVSFYKSAFDCNKINFSYSVFGRGIKNFQFVDFGVGDISFESAQFNDGNVSFVNAQFSDGKVSFRDAAFGKGDIDFHYAKFGKGDIIFEKAVFDSGEKDFSRIEFGTGRIDFRRAYFGNGDIHFSECEFHGSKVNFRSATFGHGKKSFEMSDFSSAEISFENVDFGTGSVSFLQLKVNLLDFRKCHLNSFVDLRVLCANKIDLSDTVLRDVIDMKPNLSEVRIDLLELRGMRNLGKIFIDWNKNKIYDMIYNQQDTDYHVKAYQFNVLKQNFNITGRYADEDKAYVEFQRCELKFEKKEAKKLNALKQILFYINYFFKLIIFDKMGLYATSPARVLVSTMIVYVAFSFIFLGLPYFFDSEILSSLDRTDPNFELNSNPVARAFYHSAITLFTIGYGDYYPHGLARWVSAIEGWIGIFTMSYFVVAFVRKILR